MWFKLGILVTLGLVLNELAFAGNTRGVKQIVKWEPRIRSESLVNNRKTISLQELRPFLETSFILENKKDFSLAPYIIAENESRLESGPGTIIYAKGIMEIEEPESQYTICREGKTYTHPLTGEVLGFEAMVIGTAALKTLGEPAEFVVKSAKESIEIGNRLLPAFASELPATLTLRPAKTTTEEGYILSARGTLNQIGRNQIVMISLGFRNGLEEGNVLDIYQPGKIVRDPYLKGWRKKGIQLPDNRVGSLLVFQTYEKLSLALVLEASEIIHLLDKVKSP